MVHVRVVFYKKIALLYCSFTDRERMKSSSLRIGNRGETLIRRPLAANQRRFFHMSPEFIMQNQSEIITPQNNEGIGYLMDRGLARK
jgi:hypothetical protein